MCMMKSQILSFMDSTKTQKPKYMENEKLSFLLMKKFIHCTLGANYITKNNFLADFLVPLTILQLTAAAAGGCSGNFAKPTGRNLCWHPFQVMSLRLITCKK